MKGFPVEGYVAGFCGLMFLFFLAKGLCEAAKHGDEEMEAEAAERTGEVVPLDVRRRYMEQPPFDGGEGAAQLALYRRQHLTLVGADRPERREGRAARTADPRTNR